MTALEVEDFLFLRWQGLQAQRVAVEFLGGGEVADRDRCNCVIISEHPFLPAFS